MINLYDWYVSFGFVLESGGQKLPVEDVLARFIAALAELQFLGYIKSTQRKSDHVTRMTFELLQ